MKVVPNISVVLGTRPEAIKFAILLKKLKQLQNIKTKIILTGQHKASVKEIFSLFGIKEDLDFNIMKQQQSLSYITTEVLNKLEKEFEENTPNIVIVQGDTTSAFAASLAAFYKRIPVAHIEAGLRTNNLYNPYPEEVNRRLISQLATLHFAPTYKCAENLKKEGIQKYIKITGNTVIDSLLYIEKNKVDKIKEEDYCSKDYILVTIHRRENWGKPLEEIAKGLLLIINKHKNLNIVIPMHPNKLVQEVLIKFLSNHKRINLIEPLNYVDFIFAIKNSKLILTDSGGLQEEAPSFGKPVLILRDNTERVEALEAGNSKLVGTNSQNIFDVTNEILEDKNKYIKMSKKINPFGDGFASNVIVESLLNFLNSEKNSEDKL